MHTATVGKALNLLDAVPCLTSPDRMTLGNNTLAFLKVITIQKECQKEGQEERRKEDQEEVIVYNTRDYLSRYEQRVSGRVGQIRTDT